MALIGSSNEEKIWNYLKLKGFNDYACAGIMGNLYAESGLKPNNLQDTGNKSLGMTDDEYATAIDNGTYTKEQFMKDSQGFGLAQWTYWTRKRNLYEFAKAAEKSIADLEMQLDFFYKELSESYKTVWSKLKTATSVLDASNVMLLEYEIPANRSTEIQRQRASIGQGFYDKYATQTNKGVNAVSEFKMRTTKPEAGNKYYITKANGGWSNAIQGSPTDSDCDVLSNCVGYAYGRFNEIGGYGHCKYLYPTNAENFIQYAGNLEVGQTPKLGACMVWRKGATLSGSDGAGHVAIVEKVVSETEVLTSESGWNDSRVFWTRERTKGADGNWSASSGYTFLGFIYNPAVADSATPSTSTSASTQTSASTNTTQTTTTQTSSSSTDFAKGDIVQFNGTKQYSNSMATVALTTTPSKAKITNKASGTKHPYHCRAVNDNGMPIAGVYGWVDAADLSAIDSGSTTTTTTTSTTETATTNSVYTVGKTYKVQTGLAVRTGAGKTYPRKTYSQLTLNAKKNATSSGYLLSGSTVTCLEVKTVGSDIWMRIPSGWCAAYFDGKYYIK